MTRSILNTAAIGAVTAVATSTLVLGTANAHNEIFEAEGHRSVQLERTQKHTKPASRLPLSMHFGVDFIPAPVFSLAPLDHWALLVEDEQAAGQGPAPLRFGITRDLMVFEEDGQWVDVPTGRLWRIEIQTQDAENARLGIAGMDLPKGAELRLYMHDHLEMIAGPFTDDGPMNNGEVWSFTMPGDTVVVEYFESGKDAGQFGLPFAIDAITHGYRPILRHGGDGFMGNCHNHTACYSQWSDHADAAALVIYGGGYLCSGQLIATSSNDETPYYITANHCIGNQSQASSAEFRFRYERTSCTGGYSNGTAVYGSTLVAEWPNSDNTLLRISGALPSWAFFPGWTTDDPPNGTDSTSIHYPGGDYSSISFCDAVSNNGVCGSSNNWVGTSWNNGVTEPGSSGSALYRNSDQKLYAVLTCGSSSCGNQNGLDGYGRFSRAYENAFSNYLGSEGTSDDSYEPNDSCAASITMSNGNYSLAVLSTSDDWFRFNVPGGETHEVTLDFSNSNGDIDVVLYSACGGTVLASGTSNTNDESISWNNDSGTTVAVVMHVYLDSGTYNQYSMAVNSGGGGGGGDCPAGFTADCQGTCFPDGVYTDWQGDTFCDDGSYIPADYCDYPNYDCNDCPAGVAIYLNCDEFNCDDGDCTGCDGGGGGGGGGGGSCDDATVITTGDTSFNTTGSSNVLDLSGNCDPGEFGDDSIYNVIFFEFTPAESGDVEVSTCNQASFDTRISVHAGDCDPGSVVACLDDTEGCDGFTTIVNFNASAGSTYYIAVGGYSATDTGTGTLSVSTNGGGGGGGGGDCPDGWAPDCQGNCFPQYVYDSWLGDTYCDNGAYVPYDYGCTECTPGQEIYLNCDDYACDNGDCGSDKCDGGGGGGGGGDGDCDPATVTLGDNAVDTSSAVGVTLDLTGYCDPGEFGDDALLNTAFFGFTAPGNGTYTVSTCNQAAWDTRLSVHTADCDPSSVITCLDDTDGCENYTTTISFEATAGTAYVIALGGYSASDYGPATLSIDGDDGGGGGDPTGACCQDGDCSILTAAACEAAGGNYYGNGSTCQQDLCNPTGACCEPGPAGNCDDSTLIECEAIGGTFAAGQECTPNLCGPYCTGDLNGDDVVNGSDLTILLGSWGASGGDLNGDFNTDGSDLTLLLGNWGDC